MWVIFSYKNTEQSWKMQQCPHIQTHSFMCSGAILLKARKEVSIFPRVSTGKNKTESWGKERLRKWQGLKWFKPCDIWFHGDSFNELHRPKHEKSDSLPSMQHSEAWVASLNLISGLSMNRGSAGTVGGLPQPCEVDLQFIRENKRRRKEALHFNPEKLFIGIGLAINLARLKNVWWHYFKFAHQDMDMLYWRHHGAKVNICSFFSFHNLF